MSRQKRIAAYSDQKHICDNTVIMGILAKDLVNVENSNINKYYKNLETPRIEIEKNSQSFELKYILAILNSNLIEYFLKYNSGGKIDSYPDDWKKIPIKIIPKSKQNESVKISNILIDLNTKFQLTKTKFLHRIQSEFDLTKIPKILENFYEMENKQFIFLIEKISKQKLTLKEKDEWDDYFAQYKSEIENLPNMIEKSKNELNRLVYALYRLNSDEIKTVENDL